MRSCDDFSWDDLPSETNESVKNTIRAALYNGTSEDMTRLERKYGYVKRRDALTKVAVK